MSAITNPATYLEARMENAEASIASVIKNVAKGDWLERALLGYQQRAVLTLETGCNVLVIEKSRRIGMTWGLAAAAVLRASRRKSAGGMDWLYISYSQDMTREFIDACGMWARLFQIAASDAQEFLFEDEKDGEETRSIKACRTTFASGFEIVGLSSAPRSLRGKQGVVMIDEAGFVDSLDELKKSAMALLMWGGQVIICSTHNGTDNPFNTLVNDIRAGRLKYELMRIDLDDALSDGLYKRICQVSGQTWTTEKQTAWRASLVADYGDAADEELFCVPAQGSGSWLSTELIERQMKITKAPLLRWQWPKDYLSWSPDRQRKHIDEKKRELDVAIATLDPKQRHAMGFDFGRVADLSVAVILSIDALMKRTTAITLEMRNAPYDEQRELLLHLYERLPRRSGAALDATGSGGVIAEAMGRMFGAYDVNKAEGGEVAAIHLTSKWYFENMPRVRDALENDDLQLHRDDEHAGDLRLVKQVKGVPTIPAVRTGVTGLKRHGDFAVALGLGWYATLMNTLDYGYESLGATSSEARDNFMTSPDHRDDWQSQDEWRRPAGDYIKGAV
jgi:phage FluMu gp28-like protein